MQASEAINLIYALSSATQTTVKQANTLRGVTKKSAAWEAQCAGALFAAIIGRKPTTEEAAEIWELLNQ